MKGLGAPKILKHVVSAIGEMLHSGVIGALESQYQDRGRVGPYRGHKQGIKRPRRSKNEFRPPKFPAREMARRVRQATRDSQRHPADR